MPELPEVESIRRQLVPWLTGLQIISSWSHPSEKFSPALETIGMTIESVNRRGKYLLLELDDEREMVIHLGMTGQLTRTESLSDPYLRAWWELDNRSILGFRDVRRFGRIRVVTGKDYEGTLAHVGPEPLSSDFTPEKFYADMRKSSRKVKTQLLSQKPVACVGNSYADEACFRAGVYPGLRRVTRKQAERLHLEIKAVLELALQNGGTTLRDYVNAEGAQGRNQEFLLCYGRSDEPCYICGDILKRTVIDGRGTTYCRGCQKR
mgnify:FL=1